MNQGVMSVEGKLRGTVRPSKPKRHGGVRDSRRKRRTFRKVIWAGMAKSMTMLAAVLPDSNRWRYLSHLPQLHTWKKTHNERYPTFRSRWELFDHLNEEHLRGTSIDFLEFGVYRGQSIKHWSKRQRHPQSRFFGFDTFTGLPEDWDNFIVTTNRTTFDTSGAAPAFDDSRVRFVRGMFQDTLDGFLKEYRPQGQLVIHNDCVLYSATLYVLTRCNDFIAPGTIIVFDEFSSIMHEFRALADYCAAYRRTYEVIGATKRKYAQVAIRMH